MLSMSYEASLEFIDYDFQKFQMFRIWPQNGSSSLDVGEIRSWLSSMCPARMQLFCLALQRSSGVVILQGWLFFRLIVQMGGKSGNLWFVWQPQGWIDSCSKCFVKLCRCKIRTMFSFYNRVERIRILCEIECSKHWECIYSNISEMFKAGKLE